MSEDSYSMSHLDEVQREYTAALSTPPSDHSSPHSPSEDSRARRGSNDSHDTVISSSTSTSEKKTEKRLGKDEKLAREKKITIYIDVYDIINLPMGKMINYQGLLH